MAKFAASVADLNNHIASASAHADTKITTNVTVNGTPQTTVHGALLALNSYVVASFPGNATTTTAGLVKLVTDLGGTGASPQVKGLLGLPINISDGLPNNGIIYFDTSSSQWKTGYVPASGDLSNYTESGIKYQRVFQLTGDPGAFQPILVSKGFRYQGTQSAFVVDTNSRSGGADLGTEIDITAGSLTNASNTNYSGSIVINPGTHAGNRIGSVTLANNNIQSFTFAASKANLIGGTTALTPANAATLLTGLGTAPSIIGNSTDPTSTTQYGAVIYSLTGQLRYRNYQSTKNYWVGNPENPEIWRDASNNNSGGIYRERLVSALTAGASVVLKTYAVTDTTIFSSSRPMTIAVKLITHGMTTDGANTKYYEKIYNLKVLSPNTLSLIDSSTAIELGNGTWTLPSLAVVGSSFTINSGFNAGAGKIQVTVEIRQY